MTPPAPEDLAPGDEFERRIADVDADDLALATAVLREPNPIHYSRVHAEDAGFPERVAHGPVNGAYAAQAALLVAEHPDDLRSLEFRFEAFVFAGDTVTATAIVRDVTARDGEYVVELDLALEKPDGTVTLRGTAEVRR